jgi:hypothetical protein
MPSRERIDAYRDRRPGTLLSDDMIAWELDHAPDCAAEVPPEFKAELEWMAADDGLATDASAMVAATKPAALYDFASSPHGGRWKPLPDHGHEPAINPRTGIDHSIVGSGAGAWAMFANSSSLESTNIVLKTGYLWQCMSRREQADANLQANTFAISTETEDNGDPNRDPWTPAQLDTIVWIHLQDIADFGIPRRICPDWDAGGVGYHTLFGAPSPWTPVAKSCPGAVRIRQWHEQVVPRILGTLEQEVNDVTKQEFLDALGEFYRQGIVPGQDTFADTYRVIVDRQTKQLAEQQATNGRLAETNVLLSKLIDLLRPEPPA